MATLRDIKRRIGSVKNTQQITSAMKMISAAKLARAQLAAQAAQPYAQRMREMVTRIARGLSGEDHPLFQVREGGGSLVLLLTSDRGLCGGFNNNLSRNLLTALNGGELGEAPELCVFGRTGNDFFRRRQLTIRKAWVRLRDTERRTLLAEVISETVDRFLVGEIHRVHLAYNRFYNAVRQEPLIVPLLPIQPPEEDEEQVQDLREALFEPERGVILDRLLPSYLKNQLLTAQLNTEAGEHAARMVAMEGASRNAGEMISALTLQYNRARQAVITRELIEIISGAEAL